MKMRRILAAALTFLSLFLGLLLPMITAAGQEFALSRRFWPLVEPNAHYAYQGTLLNRVVALNAFLNASPAVTKNTAAAQEIPEFSDVASLLPVPTAPFESAAFSLAPKQYPAEYGYIEYLCRQDDMRLSVIADAETGLPLRLEAHYAPDALQSWLADRSLWDILHAYADCLALGEPTDDESAVSDILQTQSARLRGTMFRATVTVVPSSGLLLLKLDASAPD